MKPVSIDYMLQDVNSRIAIISWRLVAPRVSRCGIFQFEDVLAQIDAVDIVAPQASLADPRWALKLTTAARRARLPTKWLAGRRIPPLRKEYDLLFVVCESAADLKHMGPLEPWLERSRKSICYLGEMWRNQTPKKGSAGARCLAQFDHVLLTCFGTIEALSQEIERPVSYLPPAVDSLFFCPHPQPPQRCIDIYNMGRRSESTHRATKALAAERNLFYLHDTLRGNNFADPVEHRRLLAQLIMRTKYFVTYPGKVDLTKSTKGQEEVGGRYFEGAAGGAVMIGRAPETPMFARYFDYEGAVIEMPYGTEDVASVYDALESQPEVVERIRLSNVVHSLTRQDWAYHWKEVLRELGMEPLPQLAARTDRLRGLAAAIESNELPSVSAKA